jgi:predicted DNA-binding protein
LSICVLFRGEAVAEGAIIVMTSITLTPVIEQRLSNSARRKGVSEEELLRALIEDGLDDLDDVQMAAERLDRPLPPLTSAQARQALGLDD